MNDPLLILLSAIAGLVLGALFFGGLWWTVRRALASPSPALWFFSSLLIRMGIALAGLYYVGKDDWKRMTACVVGFMVARLAITWLTRSSCGLGKEESHAP